MQDGDDWSDVKAGAKTKWQGYKIGILDNDNYYNKKEAEERTMKQEDHIIKHQSAFLDSDLGKIVYDEYTKGLGSLQLIADDEGAIINNQVAFKKRQGAAKGKTKDIDITSTKQLTKHLKNISPKDYQMALTYFEAKGKGQMDSSFVGMFTGMVSNSGAIIPGSDLEKLQNSMISVGQSQEFNQFLNVVVQRKTILKGINQHSAIFSNQATATTAMKERQNVITLLSTQSVNVDGQNVAFRDYITSDRFTTEEKQSAILNVRQKWMDVGKDVEIFDTYMDMFGTYTPALQTLNQQF